jgi:hypothetical protein
MLKATLLTECWLCFGVHVAFQDHDVGPFVLLIEVFHYCVIAVYSLRVRYLCKIRTVGI